MRGEEEPEGALSEQLIDLSLLRCRWCQRTEADIRAQRVQDRQRAIRARVVGGQRRLGDDELRLDSIGEHRARVAARILQRAEHFAYAVETGAEIHEWRALVVRAQEGQPVA